MTDLKPRLDVILFALSRGTALTRTIAKARNHTDRRGRVRPRDIDYKDASPLTLEDLRDWLHSREVD